MFMASLLELLWFDSEIIAYSSTDSIQGKTLDLLACLVQITEIEETAFDQVCLFRKSLQNFKSVSCYVPLEIDIDQVLSRMQQHVRTPPTCLRVAQGWLVDKTLYLDKITMMPAKISETFISGGAQ